MQEGLQIFCREIVIRIKWRFIDSVFCLLLIPLPEISFQDPVLPQDHPSFQQRFLADCISSDLADVKHFFDLRDGKRTSFFIIHVVSF